MAKIRIISDIHFDNRINGRDKDSPVEDSLFYNKYYTALHNENTDVTLIAGDLASCLDNYNDFLHTFFENKNCIFVGGNHDLYQRTDKTIYEIKDELKHAFPLDHTHWHYLDNDWMWIPNAKTEVAVIGSTLYTDYTHNPFTVETYNKRQLQMHTFMSLYGLNPGEYVPVQKLTKSLVKKENKLIASEYLNDFRWGYEKRYKNITPDTYIKLNKLAKKRIIECHDEILKINPNAKIILLTHHCLSPKCIDERYKDSILNASYTSNDEKFVEKLSGIKLVISGHVHCRKDFTFGKNHVKYIINACGYIPRGEDYRDENDFFNPNLILDTKEL